jgi:hypothetical protein
MIYIFFNFHVLMIYNLLLNILFVRIIFRLNLYHNRDLRIIIMLNMGNLYL